MSREILEISITSSGFVTGTVSFVEDGCVVDVAVVVLVVVVAVVVLVVVVAVVVLVVVVAVVVLVVVVVGISTAIAVITMSPATTALIVTEPSLLYTGYGKRPAPSHACH